jgi:RNA recognition motif-containing protein
LTQSATAYVNFEKMENGKVANNRVALLAKDRHGFEQINGREMRITLFNRDMVKQHKLNVWVKNLPRNASSKKLFQMFSHIGDIFSCCVPQDGKGKFTNYGFVQFTTTESANKAIALMNGFEVEEKKLVVAVYNPAERKEARGFTNLYVKDLPAGVTTEEGLRKLFESTANIPVKSVYLKENELNGKKSYFGFVSYEKPEEAKNAMDIMAAQTFNDLHLYVVKALTKEQRVRETIRKRIEMRNQSRKFTLHVRSVKGEPLAEAQLEDLKRFGEIKQIVITKREAEGGPTNLPVGFVVFAREEDAAKVLRPPRHLLSRQLLSIRREARSK